MMRLMSMNITTPQARRSAVRQRVSHSAQVEAQRIVREFIADGAPHMVLHWRRGREGTTTR